MDFYTKILIVTIFIFLILGIFIFLICLREKDTKKRRKLILLILSPTSAILLLPLLTGIILWKIVDAEVWGGIMIILVIIGILIGVYRILFRRINEA